MKTIEIVTEVQRLNTGAWVVQHIHGDIFALDGSYRVERVSRQFRTRQEAARWMREVAS